MHFSVVLSTYINENSEYLKQSLLSIINQTIIPNEIIIVYDGEVPSSQKNVVQNILKTYNNISFNVIELPNNVGRGLARNIGVEKASYELVAIMDSDDLSKKNRFEKQLKIFNTMEIDLVASWQEEFSESSQAIKIKKCPEFDKEIKKSLKFRCLIPNPSIMFRKSIFEKVKGYGTNKLLGEDHLLFAKMALANTSFYCIQTPLIKVRVNNEQRKRRSGYKAIKDDFKLRYSLYKIKFISSYEFVKTFIIFTTFRILPVFIKNIIFKLLRDDKT